MKTVEKIVQNELCHGCGACYAICPTDAITMKNLGKLNFPEVDNSLCSQCGLCLKVCSGNEFIFDYNKSVLNEDVAMNFYIAYSKNSYIRNRAASGGFITQFLLFLKKERKIDGAIVVYGRESIIADVAHTPDEIREAISSKYCPTSCCAALKKIDDKKKYAFVGKGCDIHSLANLRKVNSKIRSSIYLSIGLMCHHTPYADATVALLEKEGFSGNANVTYRCEGWPGDFCMSEHGKKDKCLSYNDSWAKCLGIEANTPKRCTVCLDSFSPSADIVVGDAWGLNPEQRKDKEGVSLVLFQSERAKELLGCLPVKDLFIQKGTNRLFQDSQQNLISKFKRSILVLKMLHFMSFPPPHSLVRILILGNKTFSGKFCFKYLATSCKYILNRRLYKWIH